MSNEVQQCAEAEQSGSLSAAARAPTKGQDRDQKPKHRADSLCSTDITCGSDQLEIGMANGPCTCAHASTEIEGAPMTPRQRHHGDCCAVLWWAGV